MALNQTNKLVWIVETIYKAHKITFEDLNQKWMENRDLSGGEEMSKRTFHKWKWNILDTFGLIIECEKTAPYRYYIENAKELKKGSVENWLFNTISVSNSTMKSNNQLVEMIGMRNGHYLNHLSPFYLHTHIHELLDKAKIGLQLYQELKGITTLKNFELIIDIIKKSCNKNEARNNIMKQFSVSKLTAQHILDSPIDLLTLSGAHSYDPSIELYQAAVTSLGKLAEMQAAIDSETED